MATTSLMTPERFDKLPPEEGLRYELLHGEMVEMSSANPVHKDILTSLIIALGLAVRRHGGRTGIYLEASAAVMESALLPGWSLPVGDLFSRL